MRASSFRLAAVAKTLKGYLKKKSWAACLDCRLLVMAYTLDRVNNHALPLESVLSIEPKSFDLFFEGRNGIILLKSGLLHVYAL